MSSRSSKSLEQMLVAWLSKVAMSVPVKGDIGAKSIGWSSTRSGSPVTGRRPWIAHSAGSSSYAFSRVMRRECRSVTEPSGEIDNRAIFSEPGAPLSTKDRMKR